MKTTTAPTKTDACHVAWCNGDHLPPTRDYQEHRSTGIRPTQGLYAAVSWLEPRTQVARFVDSGPSVYFAIGDAHISLTLQQTVDLAAVMDETRQPEAARLLRRMAALITKGGQS